MRLNYWRAVSVVLCGSLLWALIVYAIAKSGMELEWVLFSLLFGAAFMSVVFCQLFRIYAVRQRLRHATKKS